MIDFETMNDGYKPIDTDVHKAEPPVKKTKAVAKKDPFDLDAAKKAFAPYEKQIKKIKTKMDAFAVDSDASAVVCTEVVAQSAQLIKDMEAERKDKIKDPDKFVRAVNRFVKIYRDQVDAIVRSGKSKIGAYEYQKEIKRREDEKKAQDAADELQRKIDADAKKAGVDPVQMPTMVMPERAAPVRAESGTSSTRMVWTWEANDDAMDKLSRDYLTIDTKAIDAAIKAGIRDIPGIRIFEKPQVSVRTA